MDLPDFGGAYANVMADSRPFEELFYSSSDGSFGELMPVIFDENRVNLIMRCVCRLDVIDKYLEILIEAFIENQFCWAVVAAGLMLVDKNDPPAIGRLLSLLEALYHHVLQRAWS